MDDRSNLPGTPSSSGDGARTVDPRYLEIPTAAELEFDLHEVARRIFSAGSRAEDKVESLRRYFEDGFEYSNVEDWEGGRTALKEFLARQRRGDCAYFATATTLLLRATGLPARFVAGFLGGEWDPSQREVVVRNGRAHAWTEVYVRGEAGWFPVDATRWISSTAQSVVPVLPSGTEDLAPEDIADGSRETADDGSGIGRSYKPRRAANGGRAPAARSRSGPATELEADSRSLDRGELHDLRGRRSETVEGLKSFIQSERPELARLERDEETGSVSGDDNRVSDTFRGDRPPGSGALASGRRGLPGKLKIFVRAVFFVVAAAIAGMLIFVYRRPPKRQEKEGEEDAEDEAPLDLPVSTDARLTPVFDANSARDRILGAYYHLQESLKATRNHRRPHQTPVEHAHRLVEKPPGIDVEFEQVHRVLYRVLYGGKDVGEDDVRHVEAHCRRIRRALR